MINVIYNAKNKLTHSKYSKEALKIICTNLAMLVASYVKLTHKWKQILPDCIYVSFKLYNFWNKLWWVMKSRCIPAMWNAKKSWASKMNHHCFHLDKVWMKTVMIHFTVYMLWLEEYHLQWASRDINVNDWFLRSTTPSTNVGINWQKISEKGKPSKK